MSQVNRSRWLPQEDEALRQAVHQFGAKNWKHISAQAFRGTRTDVQCLHRWSKVLDPTLRKGPWSAVEDRSVLELVKIYGPKQWALIAKHLPGRIGKQCRERWHNHLNPEIKKGPWSEEEEQLLLQLHRKMGNKWAEMARIIIGRTDNAIKNHWNSSMRKYGVGPPVAPRKRRRKRKSSVKKAQKTDQPEAAKASARRGTAEILTLDGFQDVPEERKRISEQAAQVLRSPKQARPAVSGGSADMPGVGSLTSVAIPRTPSNTLSRDETAFLSPPPTTYHGRLKLAGGPMSAGRRVMPGLVSPTLAKTPQVRPAAALTPSRTTLQAPSFYQYDGNVGLVGRSPSIGRAEAIIAHAPLFADVAVPQGGQGPRQPSKQPKVHAAIPASGRLKPVAANVLIRMKRTTHSNKTRGSRRKPVANAPKNPAESHLLSVPGPGRLSTHLLTPRSSTSSAMATPVTPMFHRAPLENIASPSAGTLVFRSAAPPLSSLRPAPPAPDSAQVRCEEGPTTGGSTAARVGLGKHNEAQAQAASAEQRRPAEEVFSPRVKTEMSPPAQSRHRALHTRQQMEILSPSQASPPRRTPRMQGLGAARMNGNRFRSRVVMESPLARMSGQIYDSPFQSGRARMVAPLATPRHAGSLLKAAAESPRRSTGRHSLVQVATPFEVDPENPPSKLQMLAHFSPEPPARPTQGNVMEEAPPSTPSHRNTTHPVHQQKQAAEVAKRPTEAVGAKRGRTQDADQDLAGNKKRAMSFKSPSAVGFTAMVGSPQGMGMAVSPDGMGTAR